MRGLKTRKYRFSGSSRCWGIPCPQKGDGRSAGLTPPPGPLPSLNFGFLPTAPPHGAPGRFRGPKKKIVFHCGGEAAAMKNAFFLFFSPRRKRVLAISPPRSPKGQTSERGCRRRRRGSLTPPPAPSPLLAEGQEEVGRIGNPTYRLGLAIRPTLSDWQSDYLLPCFGGEEEARRNEGVKIGSPAGEGRQLPLVLDLPLRQKGATAIADGGPLLPPEQDFIGTAGARHSQSAWHPIRRWAACSAPDAPSPSDRSATPPHRCRWSRRRSYPAGSGRPPARRPPSTPRPWSA